MKKGEPDTKSKLNNKESAKKKRNLSLKEWAIEDRPREKLLAKGKKELSNAELIAILIGSGSVEQSAVDLAKDLLMKYDNDLMAVSRLGVKELTKGFKGIGEAKAISIISALELGFRLLSENNNRKEYYLKNSNDVFNYISPSLIDLPHEEFWAIYMNNRKQVIYKQRITSGGITNALVDIRIIFSTALEKNAVSIAVVHNHPTGNLKPSKNDLDLTKMIKEAGQILNIMLIEHLIVGISDNNKADYFSFHDNGLI